MVPCQLLTVMASAAAVSSTVHPLKRSIVRLSRGTSNGLYADDSAAAQIGALAQLLAEENPTKDIASTPIINGEWELVYTSTKGGSAGKLGPVVGRVEQHFDLDAGEYVNWVKVGPGDAGLVTGKLRATWEAVEDDLWEVTFQSISFKALGLPIVTDKPLSAKGVWRLAYIDDDFRVLYAAGTSYKPDAPRRLAENIYILARKGTTAPYDD
mmetsp:Transcript_20560/g.55388  ORF Transcript_20560/g.55388 Transcript_20560/m.55388 type:complete len:211 (+) Transcript_20560:226-858(+)|eukprot:CAMPEP_0185163726 /NCGR_PEP_ID=MMETSP1139-20130426/8413_1 /TAXON_ID=298111 /ORGANISM="Pavlova sp., Strain CCMP459" /LENGTH=210 /DNA_ID=CAMNT_0027729083 /DNA_START=179 /DNA_END=811 /DNA_ORIENTATION=-